MPISNKPKSNKNQSNIRIIKKRKSIPLEFIDDATLSNLVPFSNRFHLSAARSDYRKVAVKQQQLVLVSESASGSNTKYDQLEDKLQVLIDSNLLKQFKTNKAGRKIIIAENNYDETTLWRIHDAYRTDGAVSRSLDTMVEAVIGRSRTTLILDTNDYFDNDQDETDKLEEIRNDDLYKQYVRDISKINKHLNMNEHEKMLLTSTLIYGRAALLIEHDKDPLKYKDALPIAIKPLSSLRIGRVFYYEDTWDLAGIEYLDFKNTIIEPHRLIYFTNKDYHISPRTLHNGYSIVEPVIDIAEANTMNRQTNIKEINRRLWAAFIVVKYMGKKKSDVARFIKYYRAGLPIIGNRDFEVEVHEVAHDLEKLIAQMLDSDKKIARDFKIPIMLTGHDNEQAMATAGTVIHSWMNFVLESQRIAFRNVFEKQWVEKVLLALIHKNNALDTFLALIEDKDPESDKDTTEREDIAGTTTKKKSKNTKINPSKNKPNSKGFTVSDKENKILNPIDLPFKIKIQFAPFTIDTFLDKVASVIGLSREGIITKEMALEELDRKQYIPEMKAIHEQEQALYEEMMKIEQDAENDDDEDNSDSKNNQQNKPKSKAVTKDIKGLPNIEDKISKATDINNRKTKNSSAGANKSVRSF